MLREFHKFYLQIKESHNNFVWPIKLEPQEIENTAEDHDAINTHIYEINKDVIMKCEVEYDDDEKRREKRRKTKENIKKEEENSPTEDSSENEIIEDQNKFADATTFVYPPRTSPMKQMHF